MSTMTLKDIADQLGLSVTTVSRALSGQGRVKKETSERVMQLARENHYTVNSLARSLRLSDTRSIGVVVPDISNSFFAAVIKGAEEICHENDYMLIVCNSDENAKYEEEALRTLLEKQISGLIIASVGGCPGILSKYSSQSLPVVYIDNEPSGAGEYDLVSIDNFSAASRLTEAILAHGYDRIGMITGPHGQSSAEMRYMGFRHAMNKAGVEIRDEWVSQGEFTLEAGFNSMKKILALKERPRAMLFANNMLAYGAVKAIKEAGLSIPGDMAAASFDAYDPTGLFSPQIASLNQPAVEIGKRACEMIVEKLMDINIQNGRHVFLEPFYADGNSW